MRAIPHWMPWQQRQGWLTLRIMSVHHLDALRFLFGEPARVFASVRPDPRTAANFAHEDGICLYILEYDDGLRAAAWDDVWTGPSAKVRLPTSESAGAWKGPRDWLAGQSDGPNTRSGLRARWNGQRQKRAANGSNQLGARLGSPTRSPGRWPELLCALENQRQPELSGADNLHTMALVDACYQSVSEAAARGI